MAVSYMVLIMIVLITIVITLLIDPTNNKDNK